MCAIKQKQTNIKPKKVFLGGFDFVVGWLCLNEYWTEESQKSVPLHCIEVLITGLSSNKHTTDILS